MAYPSISMEQIRSWQASGLLVKKFSAFYESRMFSAVFTRARFIPILSHINPIHNCPQTRITCTQMYFCDGTRRNTVPELFPGLDISNPSYLRQNFGPLYVPEPVFFAKIALLVSISMLSSPSMPTDLPFRDFQPKFCTRISSPKRAKFPVHLILLE
jgi:hypothetical protein